MDWMWPYWDTVVPVNSWYTTWFWAPSIDSSLDLSFGFCALTAATWHLACKLSENYIVFPLGLQKWAAILSFIPNMPVEYYCSHNHCGIPGFVCFQNAVKMEWRQLHTWLPTNHVYSHADEKVARKDCEGGMPPATVLNWSNCGRQWLECCKV